MPNLCASDCLCIRQPWIEAFLVLGLSFDFIAFVAIAYLTMKQLRERMQVTRLLRVIQRDGVIYFFVLFSSNLTWFILLLDARVSI
jgi:hypothetical protein